MDINEIINNLCDKLGTTAELLIPEYAKMKIASSIAELIISSVIIAVYAFLAKKVYKWMCDNEIDQYDDVFVWILIGGILGAVVAAICVVCIIVDVTEIAKYTASPVAAFTEEMLKKIK